MLAGQAINRRKLPFVRRRSRLAWARNPRLKPPTIPWIGGSGVAWCWLRARQSGGAGSLQRTRLLARFPVHQGIYREFSL